MCRKFISQRFLFSRYQIRYKYGILRCFRRVTLFSRLCSTGVGVRCVCQRATARSCVPFNRAPRRGVRGTREVFFFQSFYTTRVLSCVDHTLSRRNPIRTNARLNTRACINIARAPTQKKERMERMLFARPLFNVLPAWHSA